MALLLAPPPSLSFRNPRNFVLCFPRSSCPQSLALDLPTRTRFSSLRVLSSSGGEEIKRKSSPRGPSPKSEDSSGEEEIGGKRPTGGPSSKSEDSVTYPPVESTETGGKDSGIVDEWGEKADFEELNPATKFSEAADPPKDEDEWGKERGSPNYLSGNGSAAGQDQLGDLKRCLVDSIYGTEYGLRANVETRAEITELINKLEVSNPTPAPMEKSSLLDGNWVLLYTAFSELLPLVAVGTLPLLKLRRISQEIDTQSSTIKNTATISNPFAIFTFSASASFEVRSPSRVQVKFQEGVFQPPEVLSSIDLPESVDIFGQKISLSPVQQAAKPLQDAVASISRAISGQNPLKVPIPGERTQSWLVTTFLDQDLRISRGDGGLFVLAREGSTLLVD